MQLLININLEETIFGCWRKDKYAAALEEIVGDSCLLLTATELQLGRLTEQTLTGQLCTDSWSQCDSYTEM